MADGVAVTAGSGTTILTDDTGSGHAQVVKLAISTDGSATLIPAEATNGLDVDVTRIIPGTTTTALGKAEDAAHTTGDTGVMALGVRNDTPGTLAGTDLDYAPPQFDSVGNLRTRINDGTSDMTFPAPLRISVTPTLSTTPAYSANDVMDTDDLEFAAAAATSGGTGHIVSATFVDNDDLAHDGTNGQMTLYLFSATITPGTENSAFSTLASDAEAQTYQGKITTTGTWEDFGVAKAITMYPDRPIPYKCAATTLFGALVAVTLASAVHTASGIIVTLHVLRD